MKPEDTEPQGGGKRPQDHTGNNLTGARTLSSLQELRAAVNECKRCPLWKAATQGVPGEGLVPSALMLVGEGPGDSEDLRGQRFVGPAGGGLEDRRSVGKGKSVVLVGGGTLKKERAEGRTVVDDRRQM